MIRCPASCWSVRPPGTAEELDGVVGGAEDDELDDDDDEDDDDEDEEEDDELLGVELEDDVEEGVDDDELELPFAADFDPPLEHAPLSSPTAATSVTAATPPVLLRRPLRIPASAMDSTLANAAPRCQPTGLFRCVAALTTAGTAQP
ncbi:hypothetical protein [Catenulispora sp. EB89]|uniref:hypothetical protein n=1 Tax=Catenulispora sp. EB89 TaxID=3156257 RepID=UPI003511AB74